jgi:hypothetical protein
MLKNGTECKATSDKEYEDGYICEDFDNCTHNDITNLYEYTYRCKHAWKDSAYAFEGDYKKYDLDDESLVVGRKRIDVDLIDYLEIDGHVYIEAERSEE